MRIVFYIFIMFYFFCKYGYADQTFEEQMQMLDYAKNTEMKKISIENEYDFNKNLDIKIEAKECEAECNSHKFLTDTNYFKIIGVVDAELIEDSKFD